MEAVCLTCQVRYQFDDDLLQQGSPVVCPNCQVSLVLVHPGTNTPLDQPLDAGAAIALQQQESSPPDTSTETASANIATQTTPSPGQAQGPGNQWDFGNTQWASATPESVSRKSSPPSAVQTPVSPAFEAPKWEDIAKPLESLPAQPAPAEQSFTFTPATPPTPKTTPSAPPLEDWSAAAARWAASGFSADAVPEFIKQPAQPSFLSARPAPKIKSFLPAGPSSDLSTAPFPEPAPRSQPETFIPAPPPLPAPTELTTAPAPEKRKRRPDTLPPWARGGDEAETREQPEDARLALSTALPVTPLAAAIEADAALEHQVEETADEPVRSSHVVLWALLVLLLAGAGGAAVWYFFLQEETNGIDSADKQIVAMVDTPSLKKSAVPNKVQKPPQANPNSEQSKTPEQAKARLSKDANPADRLSTKDSSFQNANLPDTGLEAYKNGNNLIREGKFKEAVGEFKKALTINPKLSQAHRGLGISFAQLRQNRQACQEYRLYRTTLPADSKEIPALESILKDCR